MTTLEEIQDKIVEHMNQWCPNLGDLVLANTNSESPQTQWIVALSNSQRGVVNQSNQIQLNHRVLRQWTHEIERSQRGQATIL